MLALQIATGVSVFIIVWRYWTIYANVPGYRLQILAVALLSMWSVLASAFCGIRTLEAALASFFCVVSLIADAYDDGTELYKAKTWIRGNKKKIPINLTSLIFCWIVIHLRTSCKVYSLIVGVLILTFYCVAFTLRQRVFHTSSSKSTLYGSFFNLSYKKREGSPNSNFY